MKELTDHTPKKKRWSCCVALQHLKPI